MTQKALDLSIVVPVYNEEESLPELFEWICRVVDEHSIATEVLFVDDGSSDASWSVIMNLRKFLLVFNAEKTGLIFKNIN